MLAGLQCSVIVNLVPAHVCGNVNRSIDLDCVGGVAKAVALLDDLCGDDLRLRRIELQANDALWFGTILYTNESIAGCVKSVDSSDRDVFRVRQVIDFAASKVHDSDSN